MKKLLSILTIGYISTLNLIANSPRETYVLENDWKFLMGDAKDAQTTSFDDSTWENVVVPHDWAIDKAFDMNIDAQFVTVAQDGETKPNLRTGRTGSLPCFGKGWYRKTLDISADNKDKKVFVEFDGAMSNAKIYVNGQYVGTRPFGYSSFNFDITEFVKFGEKNILAVSLDNKEESSRWYSGAGIYRNVRLVIKNPTYIDYNGIFVTTPQITKKLATVSVATTVANPTDGLQIEQTILDADGKEVAKAKSDKLDTPMTLEVENPKLWDIENPNLYNLVTKVYSKDGDLQDEYKTRFGIRTISYANKGGFKLNGKRVEIKGVCLHHDLGPIGAAVNISAMRRQMLLYKEMGCNSIRTSHNPPSTELLNLCDEMGMTVQAESFDEWKAAKCQNGYHNLFDEWAKIDLIELVHKHRNHPSIIMWSIGNEISEQNKPNGGEIAKFLADTIRAEDSTRPVTAGLDHMIGATEVSKIAQELDLVGFNYRPYNFAPVSEKFPEMIFYGSETASTVSSRGIYHFPAKPFKKPFYHDYQVSSYDYDFPNWAQTPDEAFDAIDSFPDFLGEYVWTGIDYLGEPTPYNPGTPARSSYFGILDLSGFKKDRFYMYQAKWNENVKVLHVLPHWNWDDRIGQNVPVHCYTNYPKVELFVNGKSMGVKSKDLKSEDLYNRYRIRWDDVVYQPGQIKVVAYDENDIKQEEKTVKTVGEPFTTKMVVEDCNKLVADSKELVFIEINVVDKQGDFCPRAASFMFVSVKGPAKLRALCNGDATEQTAFSSNYMKSFSGKLQAILEPTGEEGEVTVSAHGMGIAPRNIKFKLTKEGK